MRKEQADVRELEEVQGMQGRPLCGDDMLTDVEKGLRKMRKYLSKFQAKGARSINVWSLESSWHI